MYYSGEVCKLQIYSSSREGSLNFMFASLDAPSEFDLVDESRSWDFMLRLSDVADNLQTPGMLADEIAIMQ